jgi:hypothetical protein
MNKSTLRNIYSLLQANDVAGAMQILGNFVDTCTYKSLWTQEVHELPFKPTSTTLARAGRHIVEIVQYQNGETEEITCLSSGNDREEAEYFYLEGLLGSYSRLTKEIV